MHITRDIFQPVAMAILVAIVLIWFFIEESERTIPIILLISLFVLLSFEYVREGVSQKKSKASPNINEG